MSRRIRLSSEGRALPLLVLAWRLGLGPFLGRSLCLVTASADGEQLERAALPYVFTADGLYVPAIGDLAWINAARVRPQVAAQAHPGPLSTRARPASEEEVRGLVQLLPPDLESLAADEWWVLEPTGDPAPPPALPDLNWVWAVAGMVLYGLWRTLRRTTP
jgi:MYXO-CTERM domain-containing protein